MYVAKTYICSGLLFVSKIGANTHLNVDIERSYIVDILTGLPPTRAALQLHEYVRTCI